MGLNVNQSFDNNCRSFQLQTVQDTRFTQTDCLISPFDRIFDNISNINWDDERSANRVYATFKKIIFLIPKYRTSMFIINIDIHE